METSREVAVKLTIEDIRYARHIDLAALTGFGASDFAAWTKSRGLSERSLNAISQELGMEKPDLLKGLELRREDAAIARKVQERMKWLAAQRAT
jgi:hypothetical protein